MANTAHAHRAVKIAVVWAVSGHSESESSAMSPFDRAHTTSQSTLIETLRLYCNVFTVFIDTTFLVLGFFA